MAGAADEQLDHDNKLEKACRDLFEKINDAIEDTPCEDSCFTICVLSSLRESAVKLQEPEKATVEMKNMVIAVQKDIARIRDAVIAEEIYLIEGKDALIEDSTSIITEKDAVIAEKEKIIKDNDLTTV